ncbi:MAG: hypothetical protein ABJN72_01535 [Sulfitobacter sp.]
MVTLSQAPRAKFSRTMAENIGPALLARGFYEIGFLDTNEHFLGQDRTFFYRISQTAVVRMNVWVTDHEAPALVADCTAHNVPAAASNSDAAAYANDDVSDLNMQVARVIDIPLTNDDQRLPNGLLAFAALYQVIFLAWAFIGPFITAVKNQANKRPSVLAERFLNQIPKIDDYLRNAA